MKEAFIDANNKIITSCPNCGNQNAVYLIIRGEIRTGLDTQWCDNCELPYVVEIETELTCKIQYYSTEKVKDE